MSERYRRIDEIEWLDTTALAGKTAIVGGAGALGFPLVEHLARSGVGTIRVLDHDTVAIHNLTRSYLTRHVGQNKAEALANYIREVNPDVTVEPYPIRVEEAGPAVYRSADVGFDCLHSRLSRMAFSEQMWRASRPYFSGAIEGASLVGTVRGYWPGRTGCYECGFGKADYDAVEVPYLCQPDREPDTSVPTLSPIGGIVAAALAGEGLKFLSGLEEEAAFGQEVRFDLFYHRHRTFRLPPENPDCGFDHGIIPEEAVIRLEETLETLTLDTLWAVASARLGPTVRLTVDFFPLATGLACGECNRKEPGPVALDQAGTCPCGGVWQPTGLLPALDEAVVAAWPRRRLAELKLPPGAWMRAQNAAGEVVYCAPRPRNGGGEDE